MTFSNPQYLVETDWLQGQLDAADLRILDCTVTFRVPDDAARKNAVEILSGREHWQRGHIPGSAFVDLTTELRDPANNRLMFPMPDAERFAAVMSQRGIGPGTRVVLYDAMANMWAARVWWMLRAFGFDEAMVLNGGIGKWQREGRPAAPDYPPACFIANPRPRLIADKQEVRAAIDDGQSCILNALNPEQHSGADPGPYARAGHIPFSINVPALSLVDPATQMYLDADTLRERFTQSGALQRKRVITYCCGGIAACGAALALTLLGHEDVAIYDGSMTEWAADLEMPLEIGAV
jgi:thiosulfate/3-mercaptopyruvate sulfurtransferase